MRHNAPAAVFPVSPDATRAWQVRNEDGRSRARQPAGAGSATGATVADTTSVAARSLNPEARIPKQGRDPFGVDQRTRKNSGHASLGGRAVLSVGVIVRGP